MALKDDIISLAKGLAKLGHLPEDADGFTPRFENAYNEAYNEFDDDAFLGPEGFVRFVNLIEVQSSRIEDYDPYIRIFDIDVSFFEKDDIVTLLGSYTGICLVNDVGSDYIEVKKVYTTSDPVIIRHRDIDVLYSSLAWLTLSYVTFTAQEIVDGQVLTITEQFGEGSATKSGYEILRLFRDDCRKKALKFSGKINSQFSNSAYVGQA